MKLNYFLLLIFSAQLLFSQKKIKVTCIVTTTPVHCGGDELATDSPDPYFKPHPLPGKKLFIRRDSINSLKSKIIMEVTTDAKGQFTIELEPGTYCIVDEKKEDVKYMNEILKAHNKTTKDFSKADKKCLRKWLQEPDLVFEVKENSDSELKLNYNQTCPWVIPCVEYKGSYPP